MAMQTTVEWDMCSMWIWVNVYGKWEKQNKMSIWADYYSIYINVSVLYVWGILRIM